MAISAIRGGDLCDSGNYFGNSGELFVLLLELFMLFREAVAPILGAAPAIWGAYFSDSGKLFQQFPEIAAEDLDGNGQKDDPKKFADGDHPRRSQDFFDAIQGFEDDEDDQQVDQDAQKNGSRLKIRLQGHDGSKGPRPGYQRKGNGDQYAGFCIGFAFEEFHAQHHFQP